MNNLSPSKIPHLKVLIGTPVHESKDYSMERWIASLTYFTYPFHLLMVDNSPDEAYMDTLNKYCKKYGLRDYKLVHIDVPNDADLDERLAESREIIRTEVLTKGYDAWCTLECDIIVPPSALSQLVKLLTDYSMICHGYPSREASDQLNVEFGFSLVRKIMLKKISFAKEYGYIDKQSSSIWQGGDVWFKKKILRNGGTYVNVYGVIDPIYHLKG